jgi:CspA family cold shock protein
LRRTSAFDDRSGFGPGANQTTTSFRLTTHARPVRNLAGGTKVSRKETSMAKTGTVKFFNSDKGYGFIQPDDGSSDSFVHISAVQAAGMQTLDKDQRLNYEVEQGRNGKESAVNLSAAD